MDALHRALRVIAGTSLGVRGPAQTYSPTLMLHAYVTGGELSVDVPAGAALAVSGAGESVIVAATPIGEPVVSGGPFVMASEADLRHAYEDLRTGRLVREPAQVM